MKFVKNIVILISLGTIVCANDRFDRYSGKEIERETLGTKPDNTNCTIAVKHCAPHEGSRVDGTCNNYKYPTRGSARGPYLRLLNPDYSNDKKDIRKDRNHNDLPSARRVRTNLQSDGRVVDKHLFTVAAYHFLEFIHLDVSALNGPLDYLRNPQSCCQPEGQQDPRCKPILVPNDDPYLRVTDIRCLNFSRAETFQDNGCVNETISPEQINFQTPVIDLSTIYGTDEKSLNSVRLYKHGLLKFEYRNFRHVPLANTSATPDPVTSTMTPELISNLTNPETLANISQVLGNMTILGNVTIPENETNLGNLSVLGSNRTSNRRRRQTVPESLPTTDGLHDASLTPAVAQVDDVMTPVMGANMTANNETLCIQNMNNESRCYAFGFPEAGNFDLRTTTIAIFFMREHNRLAKVLHHLNPCWKDDRLFKVARQINIATASNILMYELLPLLLGYRKMLRYGLISEYVRHVTAYDEDAVPLVYAEFEIAVRYYHTLLDGRIKLYDEKYHYESELSVSNTTYRQHLIEMDKNLEKINRGTFYQAAAKVDDIQDPEISEKYFGDLQRAADLPALDIQRGRDLGLRGYNDYRHICGLKPAKKFEDFADVMDHEKIESLKKLYVEIEDVDLLAGIMSENFIPGTFAGPTLFCIITKQLQLFRFADRFWFERGDQFHSLSLAQLHEVRKTNIARFACDNADAIKFIQPRAFETVGPHNKHVPCTHIPGLDITKWKDVSCYNDKYYYDERRRNGNKFENNKITKHEDNENRPFDKEVKKDPKIHTLTDKNGKHEEITHWPMNKDSKQSIRIRWSMKEGLKSTNYDDGKYKEEVTSQIYDDGQYKEEKYQPRNENSQHKVVKPLPIQENNGKLGDKTDWPQNDGKKQDQTNNHWSVRHNNHPATSFLNGQSFTSTSDQRYVLNGNEFTPFFENIFSGN